MTDIEGLKERYRRDPVFHAVVRLLVAHLHEHAGSITPTDMREAAMLATAIHAELHIRPLLIGEVER